MTSVTKTPSSQSAGGNHFLNGGLGGLTAGLIVQPLQVIKTAFQIKPFSHTQVGSVGAAAAPAQSKSIIGTAQFIYQQEGIRGLYRGLVPGCLKSALSAGTYFYLLNAARKFYEDIVPQKSLANLLAAATARTCQTFITNPILIVKTRFEVVGFNEYRGLADAFVQIYQKEGLHTFFTNGITLALLKDVPFSAIQFPLYDKIKRTLLAAAQKEHINIHDKRLRTLIYASSSMVATFISCLLTNPLDVIRTRVVFQFYNKNAQQHYTGVIDAIKKVLKYDGVSGMFFGLQSRFMKKVVSAMVAWTIYECLLDKQARRRA